MIDVKELYADFQIIGSKVLHIELNSVVLNNEKIRFDFLSDYEQVHVEEKEEKYFGVLNFSAEIRQDEKLILHLDIQGAFIGNKKAYDFEIFKTMLSQNGVAVLSQIARSKISEITRDIGLNKPVIFPMINIIKMNKIKEDE